MQRKAILIGFISLYQLFIWTFSHGAIQASEKSTDPSTQESEIFSGEKGKPNETKFLPAGNLFRPLMADPKELGFYLSYRPYEHGNQYLSKSTEIFAGSLGDMFGLYRSISNSGGYSWQANISGGIYAEFDLRTSSYYLVDNDYVIGFPFTFRKGPVSYRINLYHQSSHVGDEYLLHSNITRIEFSYEALNFIRSYEWTKWRLYYGGEVIVQVEPSNYKPITIQSGLEYHGTDKFLLGGRAVGGLDLKCTQENDWPLNTSLKVGLQFDDSQTYGRSIRFLLEGYKGFSPHGQFYNDRISYFGIGITFEYQ
jgi:hypothetical protein